MEMIPVASSLIKAVGFDDEKEELTVEFHKGDLTKYVYQGVTRPTYEAMMEAQSVGSFFLRNIKIHYACVKAEGEMRC